MILRIKEALRQDENYPYHILKTFPHRTYDQLEDKYRIRIEVFGPIGFSMIHANRSFII
jgi:hypothetical protein